MYTPTEFKDKRFQEIFDEERRKIKENDERMIKEHQDKFKALKEKGEYQEPTEQEIRDELHGYIYDTYKDVHGIKGRFFDYESMSTEEMHRVADELSEEIRISIAYERADDIYYKEQLEKARNTEGAIISKNPHFDDEYVKHDNEDVDYGGERRYNIYIPDDKEEPKNSFADAFKNAKPLKSSKRKNKL